MSDTIYSKVSELPLILRQHLKRLGFNRVDVGINSGEKYSPAQGGGNGYRCFCSVIDLGTGVYQDHVGSWGGSNMFNQSNRVDLDCGSYPIPPNVAIITGRQGGDRPVHCSITVRVDMMAPFLPVQSNLTERQKYILKSYRSLNSAGRKNEWDRNDWGATSRFNTEEQKESFRPFTTPKPEEIAVLVSLGFLKKAGKGYAITGEGRNQVPGY